MSYLEQVRNLADAHRRELGFLPRSAYPEAAMKGNLWVAIDVVSREFRGYLLSGGRHPHLKVFQICVHPDHRSSGVARTIITELIRYATKLSYLNITARVLPKLEANKFWQNSGFRIIKQAPDPRSGTMLNLYAFDLDVPSLFGNNDGAPKSVNMAPVQIDPTRPLLITPTYVIDLNVFFDAIRDRDSGQSAQILSFALNHDIRLVVTPEFVEELERTSQDQRNDPVLAFARNLPRLPTVEPDRLQLLITHLRNLLSSNPPGPRKWTPNDKSDHIHIASSIHHRAHGFVTRDSVMLRNSDRIYEEYGLRVVSPTDVVDFLQMDDRWIDVPMSITAETRQIQVSEIHNGNRDSVGRFLRRQSRIDEHEIASWLGLAAGHPYRRSVVVRSSEKIVGIGLWSGIPGGGAHAILHLVVDEHHVDADRAIDHIFVATGSTGHECHLSRYHLKFPREQIRTRETALRRGFHPHRIDHDFDIELIRVSIAGIVTSKDWRTISRDFLDETSLHLPLAMPSYQELVNTGVVLGRDKALESWTMSLFDFETFIAPGVLLAPRRGAVIVPIKRVYADELLPETRDQGLLLSQHDAAFRLERAYFLRARRHTLLPRGTLVVFYVSASRSQAVALARVTFSETLTKTQAVLNLSRQGVLTEDEIHRRANDRNEVTVVTFDNVLVFPRGVDFKELKQMGCISKANLVTAEKISHEALGLILARAFGSDS